MCLLGYITILEHCVHPTTLRLFDLSLGKIKPTAEEIQHVYDCEECKTVIAIFARQFSPKNPPKDKPENVASEPTAYFRKYAN